MFRRHTAGKLFADLGADVIKIEKTGGDSARKQGHLPRDIPHQEKSGLFLYLNTNKRGLTLNLKNAAGEKDFSRACEMGRCTDGESRASGREKTRD